MTPFRALPLSAVALLIATGEAYAQTPTISPPAGVWAPTIPLDLTTATVGAGFEVYHNKARLGQDAPIATCPGSCRLFVEPGTYVIRITETGDTVAGSRSIEVRRPMSIDFMPDTAAKRAVGLALGIVGPLMIVGGSLMIVFSSNADHPDGDHAAVDEDLVGAGVLVAVGGLAATPVGWVMFGTSFKPEYEIGFPLMTPVPATPQFRFGPARTGTGFGFAGVGTF